MPKNSAKIQFNADVKGFNTEIQKAGEKMSELRAEMKLNEAQMKGTGESVEGLEKKHSILQKQLEASEEKTGALEKKLAKAVEIFGENSTEASKLRTQLLNAQTAEEKLRQSVNAANAKLQDAKRAADTAGKSNKSLTDTVKDQREELDDLKNKYVDTASQYGKNSKESRDLAKQIKKLSSELNDNESKLKQAETAADKLDGSFEETERSAGKFGETLKNIGGGACKVFVAGAATVTAAAAGAVIAFLGSAESTREYREEQGKLDAAFESSGKSAKSAESTYGDLFRVIGESDQSVEAAQQIALLADSEENAGKWADYASGVVGKFGDALQPETFYESA